MSEQLTTRDALEELLEDLLRESPAVVVLFTDTSCRVADAVEPKLSALLRDHYPALRFTVVSRSDSPQLVARLGVVAYPTVIAWLAGKETSRFVRAFSMSAIEDALDRPYALLFGS